jgi:exonuclease SbcC
MARALSELAAAQAWLRRAVEADARVAQLARDHAHQLSAARTAAEHAERRVGDCERRIREQETVLRDWGANEARHRDLGVRVKAWREVADEYSRTQGDARVQTVLVESLSGRLEAARALIAEQARLVAWISAVEGLRTEVFHREALPRAVHSAAMALLEGRVAANLELLGAPFLAEAQPDLSYVARFPDRALPAAGLSGGQKVLLALAIRLAAAELFAPQLGMMVLDEPTDGLDADSRRTVAEVLGRLGSRLRERDQQLIVITHDQELRTAFDECLTLGA